MTDPFEAYRGEPAPAVDREADVADAFVALATSMVTDFDVVEVLDLLVGFCVDVLGTPAAALLLGDESGRLALMSSSDDDARLVELVSLRVDEGPSVDCFRGNRQVIVSDLAHATARWPQFGPVAVTQGYDSVYALPMRLRQETIGALDVFGRPDSPVSLEDVRIAQALADIVTIGILQQRALQASTQLAEQLQAALNSRVVIEQAKGVLAAYGAIDVDAAFRSLLHHARTHHIRLSDLARDVATRTIDPALLL